MEKPESTFGSTIIKKSRPEAQLIDITPMGGLPTYIEQWNGWVIQCWSDWEWLDV